MYQVRILKFSNNVSNVKSVFNNLCLIDRFSEADELTVTHCFTYTAAVLHSAIAVQNERRLKTQTQVT